MKTDGLVKIVSGSVNNSELVKLIKDIKEMYRTDYLLIEKEKEVTSFYIRNENYQKIYKLMDTNYNNEKSKSKNN
jgi:chromosome segregation and condensation protein ScpB